MKKFLIILLLITSRLLAQQTPQLSMQLLDPLIINPAIAGSNKYPEIKIHHRSQWVGYNGSPVTSLISYHNELTSSTGLGGYIENDMVGAINQASFNLMYAYHMALSRFYLSFGLGGKISQLSLNGNNLKIYEPDDNTFANNLSDKKIFPDANFGMLAYNSKFYVGFSVLQLVGPKIKLSNEFSTGNVDLQQHYCFSGGFNKKINKTSSIESSALITGTKGSPIQFELNLKLDYYKKFLAGLSYRSGDAVAIICGVRFKRYMIAYSYDFLTTRLRNASSGSHEIIFGFNWPFTPDIKPMYDLKGTDRGQIKKRVY